jgi:4-hydroxyacetophenone monooxygenase
MPEILRKDEGASSSGGSVIRSELLHASDDELRDAVAYADPMVLRGLIYQLTGDDDVAATTVIAAQHEAQPTMLAADTVDGLRAKAAEFLRRYRGSGAGPIGIGPVDRLPHSLALTAGVDQLPDDDVELWLEELALEPWARGIRWERPPLPAGLQDFSVVVIGAGMGGLNAAVLLKQAGINFTLVEKNGGVGGTWFENRYPGARVDSPSRAYTHIFAVDFTAPYPWCPQPENERYFNWVADRFDLRDHIVFDTEVHSVMWDEPSSMWEITAKGPDGGRVWRSNAVITAVGLLSRPNFPQIEGAAEFRGRSFHTACWPQDLDVRGKRFAVIGTGCSGVQLVPELARQAAHVSVFQRTPQWLFDRPGYLSPYPTQVNWLDRNLPYHTNFARFRAHWLLGPNLTAQTREIDPDFEDPYTRSSVNKRFREERVAFIRRKMASRPDLVEKLIPPHPPFSTRPVQVDSDYCLYDALLRDNVTLVDDGIDRVGARGIRTMNGTEHEVDVIVYATGFRANECLWPMEVRGRHGATVEDVWSEDGPRAYIGSMVPGFPNLFMIYGPNMNSYGGLSVINLQEMATRFALECIKRLIMDGKSSVDVIEGAYWRYNEQLDAREKRKIYTDPRARSYYMNEHGRSAVNCPFPGNEMWHRLRQPNFDDMTLS